MTKIEMLKQNLFWGFMLWLIGWVLGVVLFMTPLKPVMGWVITPIGTAITLWVLFKKINREEYLCYLGIGIIWTVIAVVLDYFFNVLLFKIGQAYYKLDIYIYYFLTFALPLVAGAFKMKKNNNKNMEENNYKKEEFKVSGEDVLKKIKEIVKEGNIRRIIIKNEEGKVLVEFPLTVGVIGAALLPVWAAIGAVVALVANCTIVVEKQEHE